MRITHNIAAMSAYRYYNSNSSSLSDSLEKLATGYRINRAADDAAGLAISEKMRMQIAGLNAARKNAKDGVNLVQTAEGGLQEVHGLLNRMYTLAEQAANGVYRQEERDNLQLELGALTEEIDRIAESTNFNGIQLLNGSAGASVSKTAVDGAARTVAPVAARYAVMASVSDIGSSISAAARYSADITKVQNGKAGVRDKWVFDNVTVQDVSGRGGTICYNGNPTSHSGVENNAFAVQTALSILFYFSFSANDHYNVSVADSDNGTYIVTLEARNMGINSGNAPSSTDQTYIMNFFGVTYNSATHVGKGENQENWKFIINNDTSSTEYTIAWNSSNMDTEAKARAAVTTQLRNLSVFNRGYIISFDSDNKTMTVTADSQGADTNAKTIENLGFQTVVKGASAADAQIVVNGTTVPASPGADAAAVLSNYITNTVAAAVGANWTAEVSEDGTGIVFTAKTAGAVGGEGPPDLSDLSAFGVTNDTVAETEGLDGYTAYTPATATVNFSGMPGADLVGSSVRIGDNTYEFVGTGGSAGSGNIAVALDGSEDANAVAERLKTALEANDTALAGAFTGTVSGGAYTLTETAWGTATVNAGTGDEQTITLYSGTQKAPEIELSIAGPGIRLQIGDTADSNQRLTVRIGDMRAAAMTGANSNGKSVADIGISTLDGATEAMAVILDAIDYVSGTRGNLGAIQNRLEHTINNLDASRENIQAAESTIRDTDIAEEMMRHTKLTVLTQAAQAMLAQANLMPQGVLRLLS